MLEKLEPVVDYGAYGVLFMLPWLGFHDVAIC